jgi:hypothetical protein
MALQAQSQPIPKRMADGSEQVRAHFGPVETVPAKPNVVLSGGAEFMDLGGDGQTDVVVPDGPVPGVYEHDDAEGLRALLRRARTATSAIPTSDSSTWMATAVPMC